MKNRNKTKGELIKELAELRKQRANVLKKVINERKKAEREKNKLTKQLAKLSSKLEETVIIDSHTRLYNHRYLGEVLEREFHRAKRHAFPLSLVMIDVDYFKSINDVYGHKFGDLILKQLARQLKRRVRRYDIIVRYGGEEFVIISPETEGTEATIIARRLLENLRLYKFGNKDKVIKLKLSMAIASYPDDEAVKNTDLIEIAESVLNKVKEAGGDRVYSSLDVKENRSPALSQAGKKRQDVKFLQEKIDKLSKQANQGIVEAVFAFAKTLEFKDQYTGEHVEQTVYYAVETARAMGLYEKQVELVKKAAILHDLGKIGISERILCKKAKLMPNEFKEIKKHPQIAADIIRPIQFLHALIPLVLYHHERWDGKGYPFGLKGKEIPLGARIISVADVYQALISNRPYRQAFSKEEAIKMIKDRSGANFDPRIVKIFLKVIASKQNSLP